jgi:hypothetical protein
MSYINYIVHRTPYHLDDESSYKQHNSLMICEEVVTVYSGNNLKSIKRFLMLRKVVRMCFKGLNYAFNYL